MDQKISLFLPRSGSHWCSSTRAHAQLGASMIEYGVLVMFLVLIAVIGVRATGEALSNNIDTSRRVIQAATAAGDVECIPGSPIFPACLD